jgi:energy-coupling factor transporter transmembrane protein EcfT
MNKTLLGYVPEESPIYVVHPFVKLFFMLVVSLFPMFIAAPEWNSALIILILILMWYSRIDIKILRFYVPIAISMGSVILLTYTVFGGNHPEFITLVRVLGIRIYWERVRDAIVVYFRILPMIFTMVFFLSTSRERDIIVASHGPPLGWNGNGGLFHGPRSGAGAWLRLGRQIYRLQAA